MLLVMISSRTGYLDIPTCFCFFRKTTIFYLPSPTVDGRQESLGIELADLVAGSQVAGSQGCHNEPPSRELPKKTHLPDDNQDGNESMRKKGENTAAACGKTANRSRQAVISPSFSKVCNFEQTPGIATWNNPGNFRASVSTRHY